MIMKKVEIDILTEIGSGTSSFQPLGDSDADQAIFETKVEHLESLEGYGYIEILDQRKDIVLVRITPEGQQIILDNSSSIKD